MHLLFDFRQFIMQNKHKNLKLTIYVKNTTRKKKNIFFRMKIRKTQYTKQIHAPTLHTYYCITVLHVVEAPIEIIIIRICRENMMYYN